MKDMELGSRMNVILERAFGRLTENGAISNFLKDTMKETMEFKEYLSGLDLRLWTTGDVSDMVTVNVLKVTEELREKEKMSELEMSHL